VGECRGRSRRESHSYLAVRYQCFDSRPLRSTESQRSNHFRSTLLFGWNDLLGWNPSEQRLCARHSYQQRSNYLYLAESDNSQFDNRFSRFSRVCSLWFSSVSDSSSSSTSSPLLLKSFYSCSSTTNTTTFSRGSTLLPVPSTLDLALNSTATASSASASQGAAKAINGVVNGYKDDGTGDYTQEVSCSSFRSLAIQALTKLPSFAVGNFEPTSWSLDHAYLAWNGQRIQHRSLRSPEFE
jgi:hypothetical protein